MLADELDYVIGVDPHRDAHAFAVVHVRSGGLVFEASSDASGEGYAQLLRLAARHAPGSRVFAVEGTGSYGAGLARFLADRGERVLEVGRLRRERSGGKSDALDAIRAARSVLGQSRPAQPRAGGEREALRALMAAREGAVNAKRAGLCQLRDLLVTAPEPLRGELRSLTRARLLRRLAAVRPERRQDPELRGTLLALRSVARRVQQLAAEERGLAREIETLTRTLAPQLLAQPGVDPRHSPPRARPDDRLHRASHPRRQEPPRSDPLPQALPRPQPLPPPREPANADLTDIEASLGQVRTPLLERVEDEP
jgi:hypothetical protein